MPSCLKLGFRRSFAACPRLGSCNCVHGGVVADHRTRRASEKLGLRWFFGNRRRSQTGADRNGTNPAPHRLVLPKTHRGNAHQTPWFPLREPPIARWISDCHRRRAMATPSRNATNSEPRGASRAMLLKMLNGMQGFRPASIAPLRHTWS